MAKEETKKVEEEVKKRFDVVEVPTETALMIQDNKINAILNDKQVIAEILNSLEAIKKAVC